jgi:quinol monooxygenase YgiN
MIATIATLKVNENKIKEFESCFAKLSRAVRTNEPDTILFQLNRSRSESCTYKVVEVYRSEAASQAHKESTHFRALAPLMGATLAAPPEVTHCDVVDFATE